MKNFFLAMMILAGCVTGCASSGAVDRQADETLGVSQPRTDEDAADALQEAKEQRMADAQRNLQRQVSEPIRAGGL